MVYIQLDDWQREIIAYPGNICVCSGRQIGKSTAIAIRAGESACRNPNRNIMIIASVERQALLLFEKVLAYIHGKYRGMILVGKDKPTKHELKLKNGSRIYCLPTGATGYGIRGYTIHDLYADEAHFIGEDVWAAITPALATTGGRINLLSTADITKGKEGYFFRASVDPDFRFWSLSTVEVAEKRPEPMKSRMLNHIEKEKRRLSKIQFAAEYLGQFVDAMLQFFSNEWIEKVCTIDEREIIGPEWKKETSLGVDIAGMGEDQSTYEGLGIKRSWTRQIIHQITTKTRTTEVEANILLLNRAWNFKAIGIDDAGIGTGVYDHLLKEPDVKRKIHGLNNAKKSIEDGRQLKLLKEDMYFNMLAMGERGELLLFDNDEIKASLRGIHQAEDGKIEGQNDHIVEGIVRAAWCAAKYKSLNLWIASIRP